MPYFYPHHLDPDIIADWPRRPADGKIELDRAVTHMMIRNALLESYRDTGENCYTPAPNQTSNAMTHDTTRIALEFFNEILDFFFRQQITEHIEFAFSRAVAEAADKHNVHKVGPPDIATPPAALKEQCETFGYILPGLDTKKHADSHHDFRNSLEQEIHPIFLNHLQDLQTCARKAGRFLIEDFGPFTGRRYPGHGFFVNHTKATESILTAFGYRDFDLVPPLKENLKMLEEEFVEYIINLKRRAPHNPAVCIVRVEQEQQAASGYQISLRPPYNNATVFCHTQERGITGQRLRLSTIASRCLLSLAGIQLAQAYPTRVDNLLRYRRARKLKLKAVHKGMSKNTGK